MRDGDTAELAEALKRLGRKHGNFLLHCVWAFLIGVMWNSSGAVEYSAIAVSLAVLQTFLVVIAVGGFWLLRNEVRSQAATEIRKIAPELVRDELYPRITRHLFGSEGLFEDYRNPKDEDISDLVKELGRDEGERD